MPGTAEIERSLENQLGASSEFLDHIVISGPRGVGKSYFVQIAKEYLWHNEAKEFDCESISKEDLENWKTFEVKDKKLIILENLENFPLEETSALSSLLKRVRVVATTRDVLPEEFKDKFTIEIDVPPLHKRRDDIFYFIAKKYPFLSLTNINLICLYAYHWPGNFRELNKVLQGLSADHNLPTDFEISEDNLHRLFLTLYENGLQAPDLLLTHDTCFSHILPMEDGGGLVGELAELKFQHNDSSTDIEALIGRYLSNTILDGNEIRWIFKCFFRLIYGRTAIFDNQNIFELQPFTAESLEIIEQAQKDVYQWKLGDSYSSDYDFNYSYFQHFSKSLKQEEIDAAVSYLDACAASCAAACPLVVQGEFLTPLSLLTLQQAVTETGINVRQLLEISQRDADLLELRFGVERKNIVQPVSSPEMAKLAGESEYLAIPIENIGSLIDRGETTTQIFRFSRRPPSSPWLMDFHDLLSIAGLDSDDVRTISPTKITLDQIYVVREQAERFFKKRFIPKKQITRLLPSDQADKILLENPSGKQNLAESLDDQARDLSRGKVTAETEKLFAMPGLEEDIDRFKMNLEASSELDHILIRGPRGSGKGYFLQIFDEYHPEKPKPLHLDCATITDDLAAQVEATAKAGQSLILKGLNNLTPENQIRLIAFMGKVRIVGTMNEDSAPIRQDVLDRFRIVVNVPPLHKRRDDILYFIGKKYPGLNLRLTGDDLLTLYNLPWHGNIRELDRILNERNAGIYQAIHNQPWSKRLHEASELLLNTGLTSSQFNLISDECFGGFLRNILWRPARLQILLKVRIAEGGRPEILVFKRDAQLTVVDGRLISTSDDQCTVADGRVVSTFFRLVFGEESICSSAPISELEPFNDNALKYIKTCQGAKIAICKGEFSSYCLMHKPSYTVLDIFLTACKNACEQKSAGNIMSIPQIEIDPFVSGRKLCKAYGVGSKSFNAIVQQVNKHDGLEFDYEQGQKGEPKPYQDYYLEKQKVLMDDLGVKSYNTVTNRVNRYNVAALKAGKGEIKIVKEGGPQSPPKLLRSDLDKLKDFKKHKIIF